jgi:hypothetical protein
VQDAVGELQRAAKLGLAGGMIPLRPLEQRYDHPQYDPLWAALPRCCYFLVTLCLSQGEEIL